MSALLLALLGCASDPLLDPAFIPPTEDAVRGEVRFPQTSFRVGQAIPVELVVSSTVEKGRTPVSTTLPSSRGRPTFDVWTVRPGGAVDPGVWWEDTSGVLAPGAGSVAVGAPTSVPLHLNDWIRFDRPGTYALQLHSTRVGGYDLTTPAVKLEILPRDPAADGARAKELLASVDAGGPDAATALHELAWIGSPETLTLAVGRLGATPVDPHADGWRTVLALHPDAAGVVRAVDAALVDPAIGVSEALVDARVAADYASAFTLALGAMPAPTEELRHRGFLAEKTPRDARRAETRAAALARVAEVVGSKEPAARGVTLSTLVDVVLDTPEPPPWGPSILVTARAELDGLEPALLMRVLGEGWSVVGDPAAVPALVEIVRDPGVPVPAREAALGRLATLDPAAARPVVIELIESPTRGVTSASLPVLRSLGEVPETTQQRLVADIATATDSELQMALIATYAGPTFVDAVLAEWATETDPSPATIAGYAAYLLQHRPDAASAPLALWDKTHYEVLALTGALLPDPQVLVPRALAAVRSAPDEELFLKGSDYLREHATGEVLAELVGMVEKAEGRRQEAVISAITASRGWLITSEQRLTLEKVTTSHRAGTILRMAVCSNDTNPQIPLRLVEGRPVISLNFHEYDGEAQVRTKLAQFLPGTTLYPRYASIDAAAGYALLRSLTPAEVIVYDGKKH